MRHAPRPLPFAASLLALGLLAPACMIVVGGRSDPAARHFDRHGAHGPLCPAIDVASSLTFSDDRAEALTRLASRADLSEHEQLFLIDAAVGGGGFSSDVADVLVALARNPSLTEAARMQLGQRQARVSLFSSDRKRLAMALADSAPDATRAPPDEASDAPTASPADATEDAEDG